jgi:3-oxoacyl-[acyl-carrier protein] reductase
MFNLKDKTALVTGASGGIGSEIARALHAQGAIVVLHGPRDDRLKGLVEELGETCPAVSLQPA